MKIVPYVRQKPDIQTEWGNYASPYIVYHPEDYRNRRPAPPDQTRGRHAIRNQPRPVGIRSMTVPSHPGIQGPTAAYSGYEGYYDTSQQQPMAMGTPPAPAKTNWVQWLLVAGMVGFFGYLIYTALNPQVRSNPRRREVRRFRKPGKVVSRKSKGRSDAAKQHKCKTCGKFIPYGRTYCDKHKSSKKAKGEC